MVCLIFDRYLSTLGVVNPDLGRMWYERRNAILGPKVQGENEALKEWETYSTFQVGEPLLGNRLAFS